MAEDGRFDGHAPPAATEARSGERATTAGYRLGRGVGAGRAAAAAAEAGEARHLALAAWSLRLDPARLAGAAVDAGTLQNGLAPIDLLAE